MNIFQRASFAILSLAILPLSATFLVDPYGASATVIWSDDVEHDDETTTLTLPSFSSPFLFFGEEKTSVDLSSNGNLNFDDDDSTSTSDFPNNDACLALSWTDLYIPEGGKAYVVQSVLEEHYFAISYLNMHSCCTDPSSPERISLQVVWFAEDTVLPTGHFYAGDIVFSYENIYAFPYFENAYVGLNKGDSTTYSPIPGTETANVTEFTLYPSSYVLFRPTEMGEYNAFIPNIQGTGVLNSDLYQTSYSVEFQWEQEPVFAEDLTRQEIYQDGELIATLGPEEFSFSTTNALPHNPSIFEVLAVNSMEDKMSFGTITVEFE